MTACRIGIVEDHTVVITGLRQLLDGEPGLDIVAAAPTVGELLDTGQGIDMAILDLRLPDGSSPPPTSPICTPPASPGCSCSPPARSRTWCAPPPGPGVLGVVNKAERDAVIADAIRTACRGEMVRSLDWAMAVDGDTEFTAAALSPGSARC